MKALKSILLLVTVGLVAFNARALDVAAYGVIKQINLTQSSTAAPTTNGTSGYTLEAFVDLCSVVGVTNASLKLPNASVTNLLTDEESFFYQTNFNTQAAMDSAFPNSANYFMIINAVTDGNKTNNLPLPADNYPPTAPHISNYTQAQAINAEAPFILTWDALSGGTINDFIHVVIEDSNGMTLFETGRYPGLTNSLNGTQTAALIPANSLMPGTTYNAQLFFARGVVTNAYAGVPGIAAYAKQTKFTVKTVDVVNYLALKGQSFSQTSTAAPTSQGFAFLLNVNPFDGTNSVTNATVSGTFTGSPATLADTNDFSFQASYASQALMDSANSGTTFTFTIKSVHDGTINSAAVTLSGSLYPATTPRISNFTAAQTIDPHSDFLLTWDAFSGGTVNDFISVEIKDNNDTQKFFSTPDFGENGALNGLATGVVIPAHTLSFGGSYTVSLIYGRAGGTLNTSSYPGVTGAGAYFKMTKCPIKTTDAHFFGAVKLLTCSQADASTVTTNGAKANVFVDADSSTISSASVAVPTVGTKTLQATNDFSIETNFVDQAAMDTAFPNGSYVFTINAVHDGAKGPAVSVTGNTYPSTPHISNFAAAQSIHCCTNFILTWDPLSGGTVSDFLQVNVQDNATGDTLVRSPQLGTAGQLNGTSTFFVIPADSLTPGRTYFVQMEYYRLVLNTSGYTGVTGVGGYGKSLTFNIKTSGTIVTPRITDSSRPSSNQFQFTIKGENNRTVTLEYATSLLSTNTVWSSLQTFQLFGGQYFFTDFSAGDPKRFYRVREGN